MTTFIQVDFLETDGAKLFGRPLYEVIVRTLWEGGAPGVTVLRAEEGIDHRGRLQDIHSDYLSDALPVTLHVVVDLDSDVDRIVERMHKVIKERNVLVFKTVVENVKSKFGARALGGALMQSRQEQTGSTAREAKILRVYMKEEDSYQGSPLHHALLHELQTENVSWVGVQRALEGFGSDHVIRKNKLISMSNHAPVIVEVACLEEKLDGLLDRLQPFLMAASGPCIVLAGHHVMFNE